MISYFSVCADPFLGKVTKESLAQQTLMELLIEGIENKEILCGNQDEIRDVSDWHNVMLNPADNINLWMIQWESSELKGTLALQWLPSTVELAYFYCNAMSGTLHLTALPRALEVLNLHTNRFSGGAPLNRLPESLETLDLSYNTLSGTLDLSQLPTRMRHLYLNDNDFHGQTDFSAMPKCLEIIELKNTRLSGEVPRHKGLILTNVNSDVTIIE